MIIIIVSLSAFIASLLTLYSGFGLGTLLMPVIAIFFPVTAAIAITAFVHLMNNIFKLILLRKHIHWGVTFKFGLPAILAAVPGAWLLTYLSVFQPITTYYIFNILAVVTPVKLTVGILLIVFATLEWRTIGKSAFFSEKWLPIGGLISGFFGGLSGQQGAFRTPFLSHAGLSKEQFVSTNATIAVLVDSVRLVMYGVTFHHLSDLQISPHLLVTTVAAAFLGALLGVIWLKKVTFTFIQRMVAALLYLLGALLFLGVI